VTPHDLITAIITERGVVYPPYEKNLRRILQESGARSQESLFSETSGS